MQQLRPLTPLGTPVTPATLKTDTRELAAPRLRHISTSDGPRRSLKARCLAILQAFGRLARGAPNTMPFLSRCSRTAVWLLVQAVVRPDAGVASLSTRFTLSERLRKDRLTDTSHLVSGSEKAH